MTSVAHKHPLLALALGMALAAGACQRTTSAPATQAKPQVAPAQSHAAAMLANHQALLSEAKKLPAPDFMPVASATPSHDAAPAVVASEPPLPPVAPEQMVHLVLTSGVIGEIDPCG